MPESIFDIATATLMDFPSGMFAPLSVVNNALYNRIEQTTEAKDFKGGKALIPVHVTGPMNAGPRPDGTDVATPGDDDFAKQEVDCYEIMGSFGITRGSLRKVVKDGGSALVDLLALKMENLMTRDFRLKQNFIALGDGTGRLARVASYSAGPPKVITVDNTDDDFGWAGTKWIKKGMQVDVMTVADITGSGAWTLKVRQATVTAVTSTTFTIDALGTGSEGNPANGDYVFLANSVKSDATDGLPYAAMKWAGWWLPPGLRHIIDDGYSYGHEFTEDAVHYTGSWRGRTFQNLTRTSYDQLKATVLWAGDWASGGTDGTAATADLSVIDHYIRVIDEEGDGGGRITAMYMNGATCDWFMRQCVGTQNFVQQLTQEQAGKLVPGMAISGYMSKTGDVKAICRIPQIPDGEIIFVNERDIKRWIDEPLGWVDPENGNKRLFASPGARNLTFEGWAGTTYTLGGPTCWNHLWLKDIDITQ